MTSLQIILTLRGAEEMYCGECQARIASKCQVFDAYPLRNHHDYIRILSCTAGEAELRQLKGEK